MSEPQGNLLSGFIHSFKLIVDRVDPHDLVLEFIQRRILPTTDLERHCCEKREEKMMRLLAKIYRLSTIDQSMMNNFVNTLEQINTRDPGYRFDDIIESIKEDSRECKCDFLPFNEVEKCVFNCTRRVVEKCLEPDAILPTLVSRNVIPMELIEEVLRQNSRLDKVYCLMEAIKEEGSWALSEFVHTLLESEDHSARAVGNLMQQCLEAQRESPHTPPEWLEHQTPQASPESKAFQHAYCDMFSFLSECDPYLTIVDRLYSSGMLHKTTRDAITLSHKQKAVQIRCLLREVEDLIDSRPGAYHEIMSSLKQGSSTFHPLTVLLQQKYEDQMGDSALERNSHLSDIETDSAVGNLSSTMSVYREELRKYYMSMEREEQKWPGMMVDQEIPANLARIEKEKVYRSTADAFTQLTLHGNIDEIDKSKKPISKKCLFDGSCRCIVAQGAAGIGKSMFGLEVVKDWVNQTNTMKQFQLVHLVQLRSTSLHISSVRDILLPKPSKEVEEQILSTQGEGMLVILDGFDELPKQMQESDSLFCNLITGKCLPKARILVTSRPKAAKQLQKLLVPEPLPPLNVEILGFQIQDIEAYVQCVIDDEKQQQEFLRYIESNVVIKNMMYIPLHTAIVIELFKCKSETHKNGMNKPTNCAMTLTELFSDLCMWLIYRYIASKNPDDLQDLAQMDVKNLPEVVDKPFATLAQRAYESLKQQKMLFESDFDHMGFMRCITVQSSKPFTQPSRSCSFHHLTIQEFLAAYHMSRTQPLAQLEMVQNIPRDHQNMVLRFLAGLTQFEDVGWPQAMERMGITLNSQDCNSTLLNCLFEAQATQACKDIFPSGYTINYSPMTSTQFDCFALGYCIANSGEGCKWRLCAIGGEGLEAIAAGIHSVHSEPFGQIDLIKLSYGGSEIHNLSLFPGSILQDIRELNLSNCGLDNEACMWLSKFLPCLSSLRHLDLGDNPFTGGSVGRLFVALSQLNHFQYLDLLHAELDETDIEALRSLVKKNGTLKNLIIGRCQMPPDRVETMVDALLVDSSLENISFMNIDFPRLATHLAKCLERNTTLKSVMLWDRSFCTDGALKLLGSLKTNTTLLSMTLMPWYKKNIPSHILCQPFLEGRIQWFIYPEMKK